MRVKTAVQYGLRSAKHVEECRSGLDICCVQLFLLNECRVGVDRRQTHSRKRVLVDRAGAGKCGHDTIIDHGQRIAGLNIIEGYGESLYIFAVFILLFSTLRQGLWLAIVVPKSQTGFQSTPPLQS